MKWNEAQERAIFTRDKNILVSAAAGSGKTAVLTERIRQLVVKEGVSIDEMLVVTFTNAAAAELRERISDNITKAMEEEGADVSALQEQLDRLPEADICTFDSFCLKVIRSYFYLTDVTPDFKICEDFQQEIFEQEALDQVMQEAFEGKDPAVLDFLTRYADARGEARVTGMIQGVHRFMESLPEPEAWLEQGLETLRASEEETEAATVPALEVLAGMTRRYGEILREKKLAVNQLSFADVEHLALEILRQEGPAGELRDLYRYIFIDEYQDTNELQESLIARICREDNLFMVGDVKQSIYQFRLADPSIFIRKYRELREGTDPSGIKIDLNRNFRSKPPILETVNEVMGPVMTEEAGGIAYDEAARLYPGFDYETGPAAELPAPSVQIDVLVEAPLRASLREQGLTETDLKREELEAMDAVRRIREVLGKEYYDSKAGEVRRIGLSDIVVLMRSYRGAAQTWQEVFRREEIPAYIEGNDEYFETVEILVFTNLLKLLVNRRQDIPLLSVLRSMIFGFTASELAAVRVHQREGLFEESFLSYCEEGKDEALRRKCREALAKLDRWSLEAGYLSLKDLCWKVADESGFYEFAGALPRGSRRQENIRDLIRRAERYQNDTGQNLAGFLRFIDRVAKTSAAAPSRKPSGAEEDFVRLMSIHKSKGLEFPVVILAGAGKSFYHRKPSEELSLDKDLGIGLCYRSPDNDFRSRTLRQLRIDEAVKEKEVAEEMRLLYVGMTRAREQLFVIGSLTNEKALEHFGEKAPREGKSYLEWIAYAVGDEPETAVRKMEIVTEFPSGDPSRGPSQSASRTAPPSGGSQEHSAEGSGTDDLASPLEGGGAAGGGGEGSGEAVAPGEQFSMFGGNTIDDPTSPIQGGEGCGEAVAPGEQFSMFGGNTIDDLASPIQGGGAAEGGGEGSAEAALRKKILDRLDFKYPYPEATKIPAKFTATELNRYYAEDLEELRETFGEELPEGPEEIPEAKIRVPKLRRDITPYSASREGKISGAERGTLTHRVLQELDLSRCGSREAIEAQIREMTETGRLTEREARAVDPGWIRRFFESDLGERMLRAPKVYREQEFLLWQPWDGDTGSIVQGIIDCFFEDGEGLVLIDYKTDYIPPEEGALEEKAEHYRRQIEVYRRAIEEARGTPVTESYLYFLSIGEAFRL